MELDAREPLSFPDPMVFTVANLTQYGGGARIAPHARADDGALELVVALRRDAAWLIPNIHRLFDGTVSELKGITTLTFRSMVVRREREGPIQIDGELVEAPADVEVGILPAALAVLVPNG